MASYTITTYQNGANSPIRAVVWEHRGKRDGKTVFDVYEADDIRILSTFVADACGHLNPGVEVQFEGRIEYGDCMSLAEVIEAEFVNRPAREAEAEKNERYLEVTGGQL